MLLGSDKIASLGWRDMWAMITIKGGMVVKTIMVLCRYYAILQVSIMNQIMAVT